MKKKFIAIFSLVALLLLTACSTDKSNIESVDKSNLESTQSPYDSLGFDKFDFSATALDSIEYNSKYFENSKITMINFWGTFCPPCLKEMPDIQSLTEKYDKEDFQVLGIITDTFEGMDNNIDKAKEIIKDTNVNYLNIIPNENMYENYLKNSIQAVPLTIFVDSEGNLIGNVVVGARDADYFSALIDELLEIQQ